VSEVETLALHWEGPIRPVAMDMGVDALDRLARPGVYLCLKHYEAASAVRVYAGVTKDFRLRLREHVAATLGLTYDIADETGRVVFEHTHRDSLFDAAADLERLYPLAAAEVGRMTWFCALDDSDPYIQWSVVEAMLIHRLKSAAMAGEVTDAGDVIDVVNVRGGPMPTSTLRLRNSGAEGAVDVLGEEIIWPMEYAA
jgi:predicted GIY-YIG superfamily endonuclease